MSWQVEAMLKALVLHPNIVVVLKEFHKGSTKWTNGLFGVGSSHGNECIGPVAKETTIPTNIDQASVPMAQGFIPR